MTSQYLSSFIRNQKEKEEENIEFMSPWQRKMDEQENSARYRAEMAQYHQKKSQYYAVMAHATPWGWWYRLKAKHHQSIVKDHMRQAKYHQAKILRYQLRANKNALSQTRQGMTGYTKSKFFAGSRT